MAKYYRKHQRILLEGLGLAGELILHPDPKPVKAFLIDISEAGAGIRLADPISEEQKRMLDLLVRNAQSGKLTPVAFSFNNSKIPVVIMNTWNDDCYGFTISESGHQQLASLAERGRSFFQNLVQGAISKGAKEAGFNEYPILAMEFLPPDIRAFAESREFIALFMPVLAATIVENIPIIRGNISSAQDMQQLQGMLFRILKAQGKDIRLMMGAAIHFLHQQQREAPLENLVGPAVKHLFEDNRLIGFEEQARLRDVFVEEMVTRRRAGETKAAAETAPQDAAAPPALFKAIPEKHPLANIINARFEAFSRKVFFIQKLAPATTGHYFNKYIPRDHEMIEIAQEDPRLVKTMLPRWVQNELQEISSGKDRKTQGVIEEHFRLAMFEYMMARRAQNITHEEIHDLFEGKIPLQFNGVREKFLNSVCGLIHPGVQLRFGDFKADIEFERAQKRAERENELRIAKLPPNELVKEFLWPKVVAMGVLFPLQREFAKAWVTGEQQIISINALGGVVVIPSEAYGEFTSLLGKHGRDGAKPADFFDKVDLGEMYRRTVKMRDGTEVKDVFGLYVDTMEPKVARESALDKVINNSAHCVFYILNKSKSYFSKAFGIKSPEAVDLVNRSMFTVHQESKEFI